MQADSLSRFFAVTVTDNGAVWAPPDGVLWTVRFGAPQLPAGWYDTITETGGGTHAAVTVSGNTLTVEIAEQALSAAGDNALTVIAYTADGYQLAAWPFTLSVQAVPGLEAPAVTEYYNLLTEQVAQVLASVGSAQQYATQSAQSATLSQSWAVGGTGSRTGEDTNNSQYWSQQAAQYAQQAVGFRTMQGGAVLPVDGDIDLTQPYPTETDSSVTITSAENRIDSVTVNGYTTQTGSGDPSPTNVRPIENAGMFSEICIINGTELGWSLNATYQNTVRFDVPNVFNNIIYTSPTSAVLALSSYLRPGTTVSDERDYEHFRSGSSDQYKATLALYISKSRLSEITVEAAKQYFAQNPLVIAYQTTTNTGKFYTGVEVVQGDNYQCTIVELNDRLHEGDTLEINVLYGGSRKCVETHQKATVVVDGQNTLFTQGSGGYAVSLPGAANGAVLCNVFSGLTASSQSVTIPSSQFPSSVASLTQANAWAQTQNVVIEYTLSSAQVYTSDPVEVDNPQGVYTVSGENGTTCQVLMEALQNGGQAKTAETANGCSGNAATTTKLASPVDIGSASFDGSASITLAQMGAAAINAAIVDSGDGYVKFGNGLQVCFGVTQNLSASASAVGNMYGGEVQNAVTFPSQFSAQPCLAMTQSGTTYSIIAGVTYDTSGVSSVILLRPSSGNVTLLARWIAIGPYSQ